MMRRNHASFFQLEFGKHYPVARNELAIQARIKLFAGDICPTVFCNIPARCLFHRHPQLMNDCADAEPSRPIEEMKGDGEVSIQPFTQSLVTRYVRITFVRPINEQRFADKFVPSDKP